MQTPLIRPLAHVQGSLRWIALVAILFALGAMTNVSRAQAAGASIPSRDLPAAQLVRRDGTLDLTKGVTAAIDARGWDVTLDPSRGPILTPQAVGWNPLGKGVSSESTTDPFVYDLAVSGSYMYAAGWLTSATNKGGWNVTVNHIAKWDGTTWTPLGAGVIGLYAGAVAVSGNDVYVGGDFSQAGDVRTNNVAKWNGSTSTWSDLGMGAYGRVGALAVSGSDVYVGGTFNAVGNPDGSGVTVNCVAKWNASTNTWSALGQGVSPPSPPFCGVSALAVDGSDVYVGGYFSTATNPDGSTVTVNNIAKWDGSAWSPLGQGVGSNNSVGALAVSGSDLYVGGWFTTATNADGSTVSVNNIAKWNGSAWAPLGQGVSSTDYAAVSALVANGSDVYVGGHFTTATNPDGSAVTVNHVAKWNGSTWAPLGQGVNGSSVNALAVSGSDVYAGGYFPTATNTDGVIVTVNHVAKYSASTKLATTTSVASSQNPSIVGQPVTFTATVASSGGMPTGSVAFKDGGTIIAGCSAKTLNAAGQATCSTSSLTVGSHTTTAEYSGSAKFDPSTGTLIGGQVVGPKLADLQLTLTGSPAPAVAGGSITYLIGLKNPGPSVAATIVMTDVLPANTTFRSLTVPLGWTCVKPLVGKAGTVKCSRATWAKNGVASFRLVVKVDPALAEGATIQNGAIVASKWDDPVPADNSQTVTTDVIVRADAGIKKTAALSADKKKITFTLAIKNMGPSKAQGIDVQDVLPTSVTFQSVTAPAGVTCNGTTTVDCTLPALMPGVTVKIKLTVIPNVGVRKVTNTASLSTTTTDPLLNNNSSTVTLKW
jgi:uncharacterized repeat protein (TIGR01451 family)